jgi:hypothetical protein
MTTRLLIIVVACLLVSQIATWVMLSRMQADMAYEHMRPVHRAEFGQTYR